jgi:hypothetical protein
MEKGRPAERSRLAYHFGIALFASLMALRHGLSSTWAGAFAAGCAFALFASRALVTEIVDLNMVGAS